MASFVVVLFGSVGTGLSGTGLSLYLRRRGTGWTRSVSTHGLVEYGHWYRARVDLKLVHARKIRCRVLGYRVGEPSVLRATYFRKFRNEFVLSLLSLRTTFASVGPYGFEINSAFSLYVASS